ncbi:MAG TPA: hypothetical protein VJS44_07705 [Pyrinomonadaceae bacterium]|nr:hypothetical protein [Pyrinomonadaceae bacterium]
MKKEDVRKEEQEETPPQDLESLKVKTDIKAGASPGDPEPPGV